MLDIKFIRQNPDVVKQAAKHKNVAVDVDKLLALDERRRHLQSELDEINKQRNLLAAEGKPRISTSDSSASAASPRSEVVLRGKKYKEQAVELEKELKALSFELQDLLYQVPNIPTEDTPIGTSEADNKIIREWGEKPAFDFEPRPHWELGEKLDIIDNERAANVSGTRFTYLKREAALMEYALVQFALSHLVTRGFVPVVPPIFIKPDVFEKMARLNPKDDRYYIPSDDLFLIGSAEHTMGPLHMDEIIPEKKLPIRYVGFSPALRREAGAAGKDTRGILRLHEFHKVEMESFNTVEQGIKEHELFISIQEELLQALGLPYQVILKCTADIGDPNARGVDINTWMPGQGVYKETHTADYMGDYQARRLNTRYKPTHPTSPDGLRGVHYVHMNDATVLAIGRTIAAILENYQTKDGMVKIPEALKPWMFGVSEIRR